MEFVSFTENSNGQYIPLVTVCKNDNIVSYRDLMREDIMRMFDDEKTAAGWMFCKSQNTTESWIKRFALLRADFLFFFHAPQNEKPIFLIPLNDCKILFPENNGKSFEKHRSIKTNEGFEFDITHSSRSTVRLCTLTEYERNEWIEVFINRINSPLNPLYSSYVHKLNNDKNSNIVITSTMLLNTANNFLSPETNKTATHIDAHESLIENKYSNPFLPPLPPSNSSDEADNSSQNISSNNSSAGLSTVYNFYNHSSSSPIKDHRFRTDFNFSNQQQTSPFGFFQASPIVQSTSRKHFQETSKFSPTQIPPLPQEEEEENGDDDGVVSYSMHEDRVSTFRNYQAENNYDDVDINNNTNLANETKNNTHTNNVDKKMSQLIHFNNSQQRPQQQQQFKARRNSSIFQGKDSLTVEEIDGIEQNLELKIFEQNEARSREYNIRTKINSVEYLLQAKHQELKNPLSLSEMFRTSLFLFDEELVEDPLPGVHVRTPHLKGHATEKMLTTVYQKYSGKNGYMSLENFVEFMDDAAFLQTHAPHDANDEPFDEYKTLLDPISLLNSLARNCNAPTNSIYSASSNALFQASKNDRFLINFAQFYQLLIMITEVVYKELFAVDETLALNKIIQECIGPLFVWSNDHHNKKGSIDELVLDERILLLMNTYAPNLWKVFLSYGTDALGKLSEISKVFPETAQSNEKGLFKLPQCAPEKHFNNNNKSINNNNNTEDKTNVASDSIIITESGCVKFAMDYGIMPYLLTSKQLKEIFKQVNKQKVIVSSRLPSRDLNTHLKASAILQIEKKKNEALIATTIKNKQKNLKLLKFNQMKVEFAPPPPPPPVKTVSSKASFGGLGFSEFVEMIGRVAVNGLKSDNYNILFPTSFAKVLAMLNIWGIADLKKLEEMRIIHTEEIY